jgi:hypothetical protein
LTAPGGSGLSQAYNAIIYNYGRSIEVTPGSTLQNYGAYAATNVIQELSTASLKVDGTLQTNTLQILGGTLSGTGTVTADLVEIGADGALNPGNSAGTISLGSDTDLAGDLIIEVEGVGPGQYDLVDATGFNFEFLDGAMIALDFQFDPSPGDTFVFVLAGDIIGWESVAVLSGDVTGSLYPIFGGGPGIGGPGIAQAEPVIGLGFLVRGGSTVPLPGPLALSPLGLVWLGLARRRGAASS